MFEPPLPDLILASGRRTIPYLKLFRKLRGAQPKPLIVFLKDPRSGRGAADFIWAPVHDGLPGEHVLSSHTSPHGLSEELLTNALRDAKARFSNVKSPVAGVILGGDSGAVKWDETSSQAFASTLSSLPPEETLIVTPSRRTPQVLKDAVSALKQDRDIWFWDEEGSNPYFEILAFADRLIVTGDSHNMVSECLASGKPVYVHRPPNLQKKLIAFLDVMEKMGAIRAAGDWDEFTPVSIDATDEIAAAIDRLL